MSNNPLPETGLLRLNQIIGDPKANPPIPPIIPVSKSSWWEGCRQQKFPAPQKLGPRTTCWRVEDIPAGRSAIVETCPALWNKRFPSGSRTAEEQNAYAVSAWLRQSDLTGDLPKFLKPSLLPAERAVAEIEGWMIGVI